MTRRHLLLAALAIASSACARNDDPGEATLFAEDALSLVPPDGWEIKHQKDTLVFVGGAADDDTRPVKTVLEALPEAQVKGPTEIDHPAYRAVAFDVVFTPRSKRGKKYQRRHVVLEANQHLYHAFLTAPEGQLHRNLPPFERLLTSLREEA